MNVGPQSQTIYLPSLSWISYVVFEILLFICFARKWRWPLVEDTIQRVVMRHHTIDLELACAIQFLRRTYTDSDRQHTHTCIQNRQALLQKKYVENDFRFPSACDISDCCKYRLHGRSSFTSFVLSDLVWYYASRSTQKPNFQVPVPAGRLTASQSL